MSNVAPVLTLTALVPVLDRPQNIRPLVESWARSLAAEPVEASMLFLVNPDDTRELAQLEKEGLWFEVVPWENGPRDYALKQNWGVKVTNSDWILLAADDLRFHPGWFRAAVNKHIETGCLVIGTNDMVNPLVKAGRHATHPLVHRDYVKLGTVDDPSKLLHDGYHHNSVDVEFCETAIARNQFAAAPLSHVEHLHPTFVRSVKRDATYQKGMRHAIPDKQLFHRRRKLWNPEAEPPVARARAVRRRLGVARPDPTAYWPER